MEGNVCGKQRCWGGRNLGELRPTASFSQAGSRVLLLAGFVLQGSNGEFPFLTSSERLEVVSRGTPGPAQGQAPAGRAPAASVRPEFPGLAVAACGGLAPWPGAGFSLGSCSVSSASLACLVLVWSSPFPPFAHHGL